MVESPENRRRSDPETSRKFVPMDPGRNLGLRWPLRLLAFAVVQRTVDRGDRPERKPSGFGNRGLHICIIPDCCFSKCGVAERKE